MTVPPFTLGVVIAIVVLILAFLLAVLAHLSWMIAGLFIALAIARIT